MQWLLSILTSFFKVLLPFLWEKIDAPDTLKDAQPLPDPLRNSLYDRVRKHPGYNHRIG